MSNAQIIETELAKLCDGQEYLVRECAHELAQVLARYRLPVVSEALAVALLESNLVEAIKY